MILEYSLKLISSGGSLRRCVIIDAPGAAEQCLMDENVTVNAEQADTFWANDTLHLVELIRIDWSRLITCEAHEVASEFVAKVHDTILSNVSFTNTVDSLFINLLSFLLAFEELTYRDERLYFEEWTMLLACSGKFGRAEEKNTADTALGRELAAGRLTVRASVEKILRLAMTRTHLRVLDLPGGEAHLNH